MALTKDEIKEINTLLADKSLDIPDFRRTISESGQNAAWVKKKLLTNPKNQGASARLRQLIDKI